MLIQNFRNAAKGQGKYCPIKNKLWVQKGSKIYRFICGDCELRFASPDRPEVVILISADATVRELRRSIHAIIDSHERFMSVSSRD